MRIGAHQSIAGGLALAFERAVADGAESLQIFTKSSRQWDARPITEDEARAFRAAAKASRLPVIVHDSYLINLGAETGTEVRRRSLEAFRDELDRCAQLGVDWLVAHPGAHADEDRGLSLIAQGVGEALRSTEGTGVGVLLEITAGQGVNLGYRFEHLARLLELVGRPERLGVCLDTCHLFAAGYDLATDQGFDDTIGALDRIVGLSQVRAIHVNDCQKERGCRVDRHANLGHGTLGRRAFERLVTEPRLAGRIAVLETAPDAQGHWREEIALLKALRDGRPVEWPAASRAPEKKAAGGRTDRVTPRTRSTQAPARASAAPSKAETRAGAKGRPVAKAARTTAVRSTAVRNTRNPENGAASKSRVKSNGSVPSSSTGTSRKGATSRPGGIPPRRRASRP